MLHYSEEVFELSSKQRIQEVGNEQSAVAKRNWGIALLVISQIIYLIITITVFSQNNPGYYMTKSDSADSIAIWTFLASVLSVTGTILLIVGIIGSVRCGRRVDEIQKCKLHVSADCIYGAIIDASNGTARKFSIPLDQLTAMNASGNMLTLYYAGNMFSLNSLSKPMDAFDAIARQRESLKLPALPAVPNGEIYPRRDTQTAPLQQNRQVAVMHTTQEAPLQEKAPQKKYCAACGKQLPVSAKFCSKCGSEQHNP